jgi:hypothetical protein
MINRLDPMTKFALATGVAFAVAFQDSVRDHGVKGAFLKGGMFLVSMLVGFAVFTLLEKRDKK